MSAADERRAIAARAAKAEADARRGEAARLEAEAKERSASVPGTSAPDSFRTMIHLMTGFRMGGLALTLLGSLIYGGFFAWILAAPDADPTLLLMVVLCVPAPVAWLVALARYPRYRGWRSRLSFAFTGDWDVLVRTRESSEAWRRCTLRVDLDPTTPEDEDAVNAALRLFSAVATRSGYRTRWGHIEPWRAKGLNATGDANVRVAWKLYRFLSSDLDRLCRAGVRIRAVELTAAATSSSVPSEVDAS